MQPSDAIPTVSISIPLQTLAHAADTQPEREAISEHESGWSVTNRGEEKLNSSAAAPGCSVFLWKPVGRKWKKQKTSLVGFPPSAFTHPSAWSWAKRQPTCCEDRLFIKISQKALFGSRGSSYYTAAGERDVSMTVVVLSLPVLGSIWYRLYFFSTSAIFFTLVWAGSNILEDIVPLLCPRSGWLILFFSGFFFLLLLNLTKRQVHSYQHRPEWSFWKTSENGTRRKLEEAAFDLGTLTLFWTVIRRSSLLANNTPSSSTSVPLCVSKIWPDGR